MKLTIFDFDGTLTASLWRKQLYLDGKYDDFHEAVSDDIANEKIFDLFASALAEDDHDVVISTARPRKHIKSMTDWIREEGSFLKSKFSSIHIYCRSDSDIRPSTEVKKDNLESLLRRRGDDYDSIIIYEDREDCCQMYSEFDVIVEKVEEL